MKGPGGTGTRRAFPGSVPVPLPGLCLLIKWPFGTTAGHVPGSLLRLLLVDGICSLWFVFWMFGDFLWHHQVQAAAGKGQPLVRVDQAHVQVVLGIQLCSCQSAGSRVHFLKARDEQATWYQGSQTVVIQVEAPLMGKAGGL